mmetsp:Transcript_10247/g.14954  ORF Transcript_10247/g.14954 Transcript_10247/m.14954 type:complete len:299 (+) Transcript_10247:947-1843(+)
MGPSDGTCPIPLHLLPSSSVLKKTGLVTCLSGLTLSSIVLRTSSSSGSDQSLIGSYFILSVRRIGSIFEKIIASVRLTRLSRTKCPDPLTTSVSQFGRVEERRSASFLDGKKLSSSPATTRVGKSNICILFLINADPTINQFFTRCSMSSPGSRVPRLAKALFMASKLEVGSESRLWGCKFVIRLTICCSWVRSGTSSDSARPPSTVYGVAPLCEAPSGSRNLRLARVGPTRSHEDSSNDVAGFTSTIPARGSSLASFFAFDLSFRATIGARSPPKLSPMRTTFLSVAFEISLMNFTT